MASCFNEVDALNAIDENDYEELQLVLSSELHISRKIFCYAISHGSLRMLRMMYYLIPHDVSDLTQYAIDQINKSIQEYPDNDDIVSHKIKVFKYVASKHNTLYSEFIKGNIYCDDGEKCVCNECCLCNKCNNLNHKEKHEKCLCFNCCWCNLCCEENHEIGDCCNIDCCKNNSDIDHKKRSNTI